MTRRRHSSPRQSRPAPSAEVSTRNQRRLIRAELRFHEKVTAAIDARLTGSICVRIDFKDGVLNEGRIEIVDLLKDD